MDASLTRWVDRFAELRTLVIGDVMLDSYSQGSAGRLCPEAPVPVVEACRRLDYPGGAANSAANLTALGSNVTLLSALGNDAEGRTLQGVLRGHGVAMDHVVEQRGRQTLAKHRVMAGPQMIVRFDQGAAAPLDEPAEKALLRSLRSLAPKSDLVMISDYGYGVLTPRLLEGLKELRRRFPFVLAVDSKRLTGYREFRPSIVKPNYRAAAELLQLPDPQAAHDRCAHVAGQGERILDATGAAIAAVTLDCDGAIVFERGRPIVRTHARRQSCSHPAGAGDTYLAAFGIALAAGAETQAAAELAAAAAEVVVSKEHTATCSASELSEAVSEDGQPNAELSRLMSVVERHRREGRRIVLTNGCFDILHRGHVAYLHRARALGDVLIVGVNSDESIHRLKGPSRPINGLGDRLRVLAALSCVDHLVAFHEDAPHALIRALRPDMFVKGGDYTRESLPEAALVEELGGRVQILPYVADRSTTGLIARIAESRAAGADHSSPHSRGADEHGRRPLERRQEPAVR